jgi:hypothetical protein
MASLIVIEKAYYKINLDFLLNCLNLSGFNSTWSGWMRQVIMGGTLNVKINISLEKIKLVHTKGLDKVIISPLCC